MKLLIAIAFAVAASNAWAQDVRLSTSTEEKIVVGRAVVWTVAIDQKPGEAELGVLPAVDGLRISASRATAVTRPLPDGKLTPVLEWAIRLEAFRAGTFVVPSFVVVVGKEARATEPKPLEVIDDLAALPYASLEVATDRESYVPGEEIRVTYRAILDRTFFATNAIQPFARELGTPVKISVPGIDAIDGLNALEDPGIPVDRRRTTIAVNDRILDAVLAPDQVVGGAAKTVVEWTRRFRATRMGTFGVPDALLRFAYATKFTDDFLNGKTALDRKDGAVAHERRTITVEPFPTDGRPDDFSGAVGTFTISATPSKSSVAIGEAFSIVVTIDGLEPNAVITAPRIDGASGLHVLGKIESSVDRRRVITYDCTAESPELASVPEIAFSYFDPSPPRGYHTIRTATLPLYVTAPPGWTPPKKANPTSRSTAAPIVASRGTVLSDLRRPGTEAHRSAKLTSLAPWLSALSIVVWTFLWTLGLRRAGRPAPRRASAAVRSATKRVRKSLANPAEDPERPIFAWLAALLETTPDAIVGPGLAERLTSSGWTDELARRTEALVRECVAARYGGHAGDLRATAREIVQAYDRRSRGGR